LFLGVFGEKISLRVTGESIDTRGTVVGKIKDAPFFWLPYLVIPIKTQRQTGFLIPRIGFSNGDFTFVQPFFWAVNRSLDFTLGLGQYAGRGKRMELEGRYALIDGSGTFKAFQLFDAQFLSELQERQLSGGSRRWGFWVDQSQRLPGGFLEKLKLNEVSDVLYPNQIGDVGKQGEAVLTSQGSLSYSHKDFYGALGFKRYRNLLSSNPDPRVFDDSVVQVLPELELGIREQTLPSWLGVDSFSGINFHATDFTRKDGLMDQDDQNRSVIRKALRLSVAPEIFSTFRFADVLAVTPSVRYFQSFYHFPEPDPGEPMAQILAQQRNYQQSYLRLNTQLSLQFEKELTKVVGAKNILFVENDGTEVKVDELKFKIKLYK
jgi:hypothetical protein